LERENKKPTAECNPYNKSFRIL